MSLVRLPGRRLRAVPDQAEVPTRPWLPDGMSAAEFTFREAIDNFRADSRSSFITVLGPDAKAGLINAAHAWLWAVVDSGQVSKAEANLLFRELTEAAGAWEVES